MANTKKMDYVLLGLLSHEPMTGYEMKKRLDTTLRFFWGGSYGSIYPTLNQLEKENKILVDKNNQLRDEYWENRNEYDYILGSKSWQYTKWLRRDWFQK